MGYERGSESVSRVRAVPRPVGLMDEVRRCLRLRVKDVDFACNEIEFGVGKGIKDRVTTLPTAGKEPLSRHLELVKKQHGHQGA